MRAHTARSAQSSAVLARQRLLADKTLRCHKAPDSLTVPIPALLADDQRRQVLGVVHSFDGHYLAGVRYVTEQQTTVAIVRPRHPFDVPYQISVDAAGNVDVRSMAAVLSTVPRIRRALLLGSAVAVFSASYFFLLS